MMVAQKETAEQKLLKMIESSSESDELSTGTVRSVAGGDGGVRFIKRLNMFLFLGVLMAGAFLFTEFNKGSAVLNQPLNIVASSDSSKNRSKEDLDPEPQRASYFLAGINMRNIFEPYNSVKIDNVVEVTNEMAAINDKTRTYKLVGISWMDRVSTASVMIEDTAQGVTYFLQKNDKIDDVVVKTIYAESVELGYENEEIIISYE